MEWPVGILKYKLDNDYTSKYVLLINPFYSDEENKEPTHNTM